MTVTMQKQDYERISESIRVVRDEQIKRIDQDEWLRALKPAVRDTLHGYAIAAIEDAFRALAVRTAREFVAINPRFKVPQFLIDALGQMQGAIALTEFAGVITDG